ncbi:syntaxin-17 [Lingula anatina]|uniref:Syntaxin-17 n=1 Tax=Lingula anatina TaxID=7574 RepID=A0A1S3HR10_LINAN|nr:syntaxin-17 [Lingula anatina]XP_013387979.1 syntaxin-17 [Lingula anatina]XP_013387980.1 syntaxin-17 [Lingula anatina]XP_013387981.1 syntaxin-17 [Lingula anatina]XP_013387982.1 syntaxin-17 [Lingula anatina]XP_013387983.1 syntaxin-17 [Lingula anatina]XP_013387984.1 syntaxin-17 [Lingula anatina]XP_013387985.1 syntaxin-17 [Lingula anatina]|eukprot:XP_013387978.1 syntaxin-17 [Lingula anatina]
MASFEEAVNKGSKPCNYQKYPIRRLEPSIQKFIKVLEIDLERLDRHQRNLLKFQRLREWENLNKEQINATRTIQQLKANIRELEKTRHQVEDDEVVQFNTKVTEIKEKALSQVKEFLEVYGHSYHVPVPAEDESIAKDSGALPHPLACDHDTGTYQNPVSCSLPTDSYLQQQLTQTVPDNTDAAQSLDNLKESLLELNTMIHEFADLVQSQQEVVDRIEDNVEKAHSNVQGAAINLSKAAKYKAAIVPVAGAVIGGVVAGPVGLYVGAKIGGLAAAGVGGIVGFAGGKFIKKKQDHANEAELQNLSKKDSNSMPNLNLSGK